MKRMHLFKLTWITYDNMREVRFNEFTTDEVKHYVYIAANNIFEACSKIDKTVTNIKSFEDIGEVLV